MARVKHADPCAHENASNFMVSLRPFELTSECTLIFLFLFNQSIKKTCTYAPSILCLQCSWTSFVLLARFQRSSQVEQTAKYTISLSMFVTFKIFLQLRVPAYLSISVQLIYKLSKSLYHVGTPANSHGNPRGRINFQTRTERCKLDFCHSSFEFHFSRSLWIVLPSTEHVKG